MLYRLFTFVWYDYYPNQKFLKFSKLYQPQLNPHGPSIMRWRFAFTTSEPQSYRNAYIYNQIQMQKDLGLAKSASPLSIVQKLPPRASLFSITLLLSFLFLSQAPFSVIHYLCLFFERDSNKLIGNLAWNARSPNFYRDRQRNAVPGNLISWWK